MAMMWRQKAWCISYPLLRNRSPPNSIAWGNKHLLSDSFCRWGTQEGLSGSCGSVSVMRSQSAGAPRLGLENPQLHSLPRLLAGGFTSSQHGALCRTAWESSQHGHWLPPRPVVPHWREQGESHRAFVVFSLENTHLHFRHSLLIRSESLSRMCPQREWN